MLDKNQIVSAEMIKHLEGLKAYLEEINKKGKNKYNEVKLIEEIIKHQDLTLSDFESKNILHLAVLKNDPDLVAQLLEIMDD